MASLMIKHTPYLDFGARQFDPEVATWLAPDPLSTDYPSLSPYVYCAADPVNLVDPEGKEFWIFDSELNCNVRYSNGSLSFLDGSEYNGTNQFIYDIRNTLNTLLSLNDDYISSVIKELENSELVHTFAYNSKYDESVKPKGAYGHSLADAGQPVGTWILLSLSRKTVDGVMYTTETGVAHEISHAFDYDQGRMKGMDPWMGDGISPAEINAVNFENRVRARIGLPLRQRYKTVIPRNKFENPFSKKEL